MALKSRILHARGRVLRNTIGAVCGATLAVTLMYAAAPAALADGGTFEVAFQGSNGHLWTVGKDNIGDTGLSMVAGSSPSITSLNTGGYEVAFEASSGYLAVTGSAGTTFTAGQIAAGTSPSITWYGQGSSSYKVAFHGTNGDLWLYDSRTNGLTDTGFQVAQGTSPGMGTLWDVANNATLPSAYFQGLNGDLWIDNAYGLATDTALAMMAGTSPSSTGTACANEETAFQANTGFLWTYNDHRGVSQGLGMMAGTSPSISGLAQNRCDAYEIAITANTGVLWLQGNLGQYNTGFQIMQGSSPAITGLSGGGIEVAFQATNGDLWTRGVYNNNDMGVQIMQGTSPSISADN